MRTQEFFSFNPRARGGRDRNTKLYGRANICFNPRARGGRDDACELDFDLKTVSIHAPAGGATRLLFRHYNRPARFNPRARGGRDYQKLFQMGAISPFQSTRPRGARLIDVDGSTVDSFVSIHAPAGGATMARSFIATRRMLFQSTRPRGARPLACELGGYSFDVSIHAPAGGATHQVSLWLHARPKFQSTRPRGARL